MGTVGQLMTRELNVIEEEASIQEAAKLMYTHRIGSILVRNGEAFSGIVTETDVVRAVAAVAWPRWVAGSTPLPSWR